MITFCPVCGHPITQRDRGRKRVYCCRACQQTAYRRRQRIEAGTAPNLYGHPRFCIYCGEELLHPHRSWIHRWNGCPWGDDGHTARPRPTLAI